MPTNAKPLPAQVSTLRLIEAGQVLHYPAGNGSVWPTDRIVVDGKPGLRLKAAHLYVIEKAGWAEHPPCGTNTARVPWSLTDNGRVALAHADRREE
jgi:hypothetical protein